jgi:hypothetical protein
VNIPAYQRVNTSTDYDTAGFPMYLRFDGVDDGMVTNSINFTSTDKMTVWAGVRRATNTPAGVIAETSAAAESNNGAFMLVSGASNPAGDASNLAIWLRGTTKTAAAARLSAAPLTSVAIYSMDISQPTAATEIVPRINGAAAPSVSYDATDAGTGNFGNYPLYIGRRGGTTAPFNGRLTSLIVRGAQSTDQQIAATETYVNSKTRAFA